jgi:hyperosmotically inducible protein
MQFKFYSKKQINIITILSILFLLLSSHSEANVNLNSDIVEQVREQLSKDPRTANLLVDIGIKEVVLSLQGQVPTQEEANALIEVTSSIAGVKDVDTTKLTTEKSHQLLADAIITAKVKGLFVREKLLGDMPIKIAGIHVKTNDGIVYLTGTVKKEKQIRTAEKLAKSVTGVKQVKVKIKID